jgi:hypothetical protein
MSDEPKVEPSDNGQDPAGITPPPPLGVPVPPPPKPESGGQTAVGDDPTAV